MTLAVLALAAAVGAAAPTRLGAPLLRPSPKVPVHIQADQLTAHQGGNSVVFTGHVNVSQVGYTLTCDRLTVFYGAGQKVERLVADGHVRVTQNSRVVTSDRAELDNRKRILTFTGSPVITQGEDVLKGDIVTLYLATGQVKVEKVRARVRVGDLMQPDGGTPARSADGGSK